MTDAIGNTPHERGDINAPHLSRVTPAEDARTILINRVSWGAVLAGVAISLVTLLILNMIGLGIGASTIDIGTNDNPSAAGLSVGAALWWTLSGILASLAGGYAAGRLAGKPKETTAAWHGLTAWAFTTLIVFYLFTSALSGIVGGAYRTLTSGLGGIAQTAGSAVQLVTQTAAPTLMNTADPFGAIAQVIREATGGQDPAALREAAVNAMRSVVTGDPAQLQALRERAAQALARARSVQMEDARAEVQQYEQQYRQGVIAARQKAMEAADTAAKAVTRGALFGAIALILGAIAGWFGGWFASVVPTLTSGSGSARRVEAAATDQRRRAQTTSTSRNM